MTISKSDGLLSRFSRVPNSRAALALAHVVSDYQIWEQCFPFGSSKLSSTAIVTYFDTLLKQPGCQDAWNAYTDVKMTTGCPQQLARGTASLNGFRHYSIQDAIYLEYYVRVRLEAIAAARDTVSVDEIRTFVDTVKPGLDYAIGLRHDCEKKLGVPLQDITKESESERLKTSIAHYRNVVKGISSTAKPWVDIHFALLPCIKGYYQIATDMLKSSKVVKNTLYYSMWIEGNTDPSFVDYYEEFLQAATSKAEPADWERWGEIFKTACDNEKNFFKLATEDYKQLPQPYNILEEGDYTISPYGNNTHFLNVNGNDVVVTTTSVKWQLKNSADGYIINSKDAPQQFLGLSTKDTGLPYYEVQTSTTLQKWSMNRVYDNDGKTIKGYQLFAPEKLAFVLDWNDANSKVFVANNYQGPSQTWILTKVA